MYYNKTTSYTGKPRGHFNKKKPPAAPQTERPEELNYLCDSEGNLTHVWIKKTMSYAPIKLVNKWFLLKLQMHLQETGKFPRAYKGVYAEIQRRIATGEITASDTPAKEIAA
jgi:hypothetical protein